MSTLFGRRKNRVRQSSLSSQDLTERSIPYDQTIASRSPVPVGTLGQGNRGISATNTNPSLQRNDVSSMRSQGHDFGQISSSQGSRPSSGMTVKSDTTRNSKLATSSDPSQSHLPFHLHHRQSSELFHFPRPPNEEIELLFENVKQTRGDPKGLDKFTIDQKWELVKNDEQIRWKEQRIGEQSRKLQEAGQSLLPHSPEWFIHKLMNRTITPKQASDLLVSLRSKAVRCAPTSF